MRKAPPTILRPHHFEDSLLSLTECGLQFDEQIELHDIEFEVGPDTVGHIEDGYRALRCVVNPAAPSKANLYRSLRRAQREAKVDGFNISYGDRESAVYDTGWSVSRDGDSIFEGQTIHIVGMVGRRAIGYASINTQIYRDDEGGRFSLKMSPHLVYVLPKQRSKGYGMALSVSAGWVGSSLLEALYGAVPPGSSLDAAINADYDSKVGERFGRHLTDSRIVTLDCLR